MDAGAREAAVRAIVKEGDPDRYAAALFVPHPARDHLLALLAFNVELARIGEQVSEAGLGEIKLEWWRDALARALAGEATGHPVADALGPAAKHSALPRKDLAGLIDARHFDVSVKIMPDRTALDDYLAKTAGALFRLAAKITGAGTDGNDPNLKPQVVEETARKAGIAYGLIGLMRAMPLHAARGRVDVPEDALRGQGTTPERLVAGEADAGLVAVLAELRREARAALADALPQVAALSPDMRRAFLPLILVEPYLTALEKQSDPLHDIATINPLYRLWRLASAKFRPAQGGAST